jgi:effector-binding domain-containing protein
MEYDVQAGRVESRPTAVVRRRARHHELSRVVPEACGLVWQALKAAKVAGAGRHVAVYWDGEINLEVGVEMPEPFAGHGEVVGSATPAGMVAMVVHFGPYQRLNEAHAAVCKWCQDNHRTPAGPNWEVYGHPTADPAQTRTDVFYLLKDGD